MEETPTTQTETESPVSAYLRCRVIEVHGEWLDVEIRDETGADRLVTLTVNRSQVWPKNVRIVGRNITQHPMGAADRYRKVAPVLATIAYFSGIVRTPEGDMAFEPGDYLVTDDPPTHAWPVAKAVFERTYRKADA